MLRRFLILLPFLFVGLSSVLGQTEDQKKKIYYDWWAGESGIQSSSLSIGSTVATFQPTETIMSTDESRSNAYSDQMLWNNGKTYFLYQRRYQSRPFGQFGLLTYDENRGLDRPRVLGEVLSGSDAHTFPTLGIKSDGTLYAFQENLHNTPIEIWRQGGSDYAYMDHISEDVATGSGLAYVSFLKNINDDNRVVWSRGVNGTQYSAYVTKSASEFESWGAPTRITTNIAGAFEGRHYETLPLNHTVGGYHYLMISKRYDLGPNTWVVEYLLKTTDFNIFTNVTGSFSHNVSVSGAMSEAVMNTNFLYFTTGVETVQGCIPIAGVSPTGKFYALKYDGSANQKFVYHDGSAWQSRTVNISGMLGGADVGRDAQASPFLYLIPWSDTNIEVWVRKSNGTYTHVYRYKTTDLGQNWTLIEDAAAGINDNLWGAFIPGNVMDIPVNRNFNIAFTSLASGSGAGTNAVTTYVKKGVRGILQAESGYTATAAVSMAHASLAVHYKITTGNVTQSSNNITALTDLSGNARNATGVNNPQWVGGDSFTTNGTNQYFTIPTTGLTALTKATFMAVVRTNNVIALLLTLTNNASADQIAGFGASHTGFNNTAYFTYKSTSSNQVVEYGQDDTRDNTYHVVTWQLDGNNKVDVRINGVLQRQFTNSSTSAADLATGKFLQGITVNSIRIGSLDTSGTDAFYAMQVKEMALYSSFLDIDTVMSLEKKLATDYGITLTAPYQSLN